MTESKQYTVRIVHRMERKSLVATRGHSRPLQDQPAALLLAGLVLGSLRQNVLPLKSLLDLDARLARLATVALTTRFLPGRPPGRRQVLAMAELGILGCITRRLRR